MCSFIEEPRHPSAQSRQSTRLGIVLLTFAVLACGGTPPSQAPTLSSTYPSGEATDVPLNAKLSAFFDMAMDPLSAATFTLKQGTTPVSGTVAATADGMGATFAPSSGLAANSVFTATITAGTKSAEGATFVGDHSWSFTTGTAADTSAPEVSSTNPGGNSPQKTAINPKIVATFSKAMDPLSITPSTFTLKQEGREVSGSVAYGPGTTATFTPASELATNTQFTAALSTGVKDLQGNPLANAVEWSFTTGATAAKGPAPVGLGAAGNYVILAKTAISSVPSSSITGDVGVSPAAASYITGFSLVADSTNVFSSSTQIVGKAYAANYAVPTPANLTTAVSNMGSAYIDAAGRSNPNFLELGTGNIGGKVLLPGLYKWTSTVTIPADVTISGGANDVWIFQTTGDLNLSSSRRVTLSGGAQAKNVFWQVAGQATLGTSSHFEGVLLCKTQVLLQTGATMNGRILAQTQVALQQATVTKPAL